MPNFLYLRGAPGVGKITVAREIEKKAGWRIFWFHDLKNAVYNIVQEHRIPRLMDEITLPIVKYLLERNENIIYVRPSPDKETVENIAHAVKENKDYKFTVIRLTASYDILHERVIGRQDPYRITTKKDLDAYLAERTIADIPGELIVKTDGLTPQEVAETILNSLPA